MEVGILCSIGIKLKHLGLQFIFKSLESFHLYIQVEKAMATKAIHQQSSAGNGGKPS